MLPESLKKLTVLYVEDEVLIAMDGEVMLRDLGFADVSVAMSYADAEATISRNQFDLALFDINLGGGQTSLMLADAVFAKGTKVIFVSGYANSEGLKSRLKGPLLGKPFDAKTLASAIQTVFAE